MRASISNHLSTALTSHVFEITAFSKPPCYLVVSPTLFTHTKEHLQKEWHNYYGFLSTSWSPTWSRRRKFPLYCITSSVAYAQAAKAAESMPMGPVWVCAVHKMCDTCRNHRAYTAILGGHMLWSKPPLCRTLVLGGGPTLPFTAFTFEQTCNFEHNHCITYMLLYNQPRTRQNRNRK